MEAAPTKMPSGFYYPTDRTSWTGAGGGDTGDPKQPYNDGSNGGRIYGFLDPGAPRYIGQNHVGIDIRQAYSSPVYAIADGTIFYYVTKDNPRYWVIIGKHREAAGKDFYAVYGHCRIKGDLDAGNTIRAGQIIGYINESKNQHMHFGIKMDSDFSTGWGSVKLGFDVESIGWRPPRTWLLSHAPYGNPPPADVTPPVISLTGPDENKRYNTVQEVAWSVTDDQSGVGYVMLQWDSGVNLMVGTSGSEIVPNGTHNLTIRAADKDGNVAISTYGPYIIDLAIWIVSAPPGLLSGGYFVQKADRSSGMYVEFDWNTQTDIAIGDQVSIQSGKTSTLNGCTVLENGSMVKVGATSEPEPVATAIKNLLSSTKYMGSFVSITGRVSYREANGSFYYVDDGSGINDGYQKGIRVTCTGYTKTEYNVRMPQLGQLVRISGVRWIKSVSGKIVPCLIPRYQDDMVPLDRAAR